jgi:hypothetical protein
MIPVPEAKDWFTKCKLRKEDLPSGYPIDMIMQYTAKNVPDIEDLKCFVLSPETYVSTKNEILICIDCVKELQEISTSKSRRKRYPSKAISNFNLIGDSPDVLKNLNEVEVSMISLARLTCQSWTFYGGCHKQIKGYHTFYKNRPVDNVVNLTQIADAGIKGNIVVLLCNTFTVMQHITTKERTSVDVRKCVAALEWLIGNNYKYANVTIPHIDNFPVPQLVYNSRL